MKRLFVITMAALAFSSAAQARSKWIRRLSAIAVCGASGADLVTTAIGTNRGAVELNRLLSRSGQPIWGRLIGLNAVACGSAILGAESRRVPTYVILPLNFGFAVPKLAVVGQSIDQLRNMK
jgi:hypothetical protein